MTAMIREFIREVVSPVFWGELVAVGLFLAGATVWIALACGA